MAVGEHSGEIVAPVESTLSAPGGAGAAYPAALAWIWRARALGLPPATIKKACGRRNSDDRR